MNRYRQRILALMRQILDPVGRIPKALDFGCGDGWFAHALRGAGTVEDVTAIDVKRRDRCWVEPLLYDGARLPFPDRCFDLVYAIDVLHHCPDPRAVLHELVRCAGEFVLLKDHTYSTAAGRWALVILDELGNRRFGVPSPGRYQRGWSWVEELESEGFRRVAYFHPAACHRGLLGMATNPLQFLGLWRRA